MFDLSLINNEAMRQIKQFNPSRKKVYGVLLIQNNGEIITNRVIEDFYNSFWEYLLDAALCVYTI